MKKRFNVFVGCFGCFTNLLDFFPPVSWLHTVQVPDLALIKGAATTLSLPVHFVPKRFKEELVS